MPTRHVTPGTHAGDARAKATVLKRLQAMQAEGLSLQKIADWLNAKGVPTLSGKGRWQKDIIGRLLA